MALHVGEPAPEFELPDTGGGTFKLGDLRERWVVLVFLRWLG